MTIAPLNGDTRPARPPVLEVAARLGLAAVLAWPLALAWLAPELPAVLTLSAILVLLLALWRPAVALVATTALVPAGLLLADAPASAAETIAWAFLCGWLLAARRPLGMPGPTRLGAWTALYAACLSVSWVRLALVSAHGVDASVLPLYLLRALTPDHLIFSSPEPETWNLLHALTGVGLFVAALTLSRVERRLPGWIAVTLVASASVLGVLTLAGAIGGWNASDDPWRYLSRFISGSRYSLHLTDYNAAGSSYVLAGLTAVGLARVARWRVVAGAAVVLMLPALVMSGSRSAALGAIVVGALAL
ncbi:MAG: hypothetical protein FJW23_17700, partial [Acidimicrobiia bacterium]|nr:hypothetical protein [Acidimicrobiia bacterium]